MQGAARRWPRDEHDGACGNRTKGLERRKEGGKGGTLEDNPQAGDSLLLRWQQNERGGLNPIESKGVAVRRRVASCSAKSRWDSRQGTVLEISWFTIIRVPFPGALTDWRRKQRQARPVRLSQQGFRQKY